MKKYLKRFSALFVVVAMLVAMIPMTVLAADYTIQLSINNGFSSKVEIDHTSLTQKDDNEPLKTTSNPMELIHGRYADAKATIKSDYVDTVEFIGWQLKDGTIVSGANQTVIRANHYGDYKEKDQNTVKITAVFANKKTQQFASMDTNKGTVTVASADLNDYYDVTIDGEALEFNGEVICEANAEEGYYFEGWTVDDGQNVKTSGTILPKAEVGTKTIKAVFATAGYNVVTNPTADEVVYGTSLRHTDIVNNGSVKYNGESIEFGSGKNEYRWRWDKRDTIPTVDPDGTNTYLIKLQKNNKEHKSSKDNWVDTGITVEIPVPVTQKPVAVTWTVGKYTYNGQVQTYPTAKYKNIGGKDVSCTVQINGEKEFKNYDADGYSFTATTDDANYKLINETISDVQIGKAPLTVKWTYEEPYIYGDGKTAPTVEAKGAVNDETPVLSNPEEVDTKIFKNTGTYQFKTKLTNDDVNANYYLQGTSHGKTYVYSKEVYIFAKGVDLPTAVTGLVYNGEEQTGVSVGSQDPVYFVFESEKGIEAGEYEATVKLDDKLNYHWNSGGKYEYWDIFDKKVKFTIAPKDPEKADFVFTAPKNLEFTGDNKTAEVKLLDKYTDTDSEKAKNVVSLKYYKDGEEATNTAEPGTYTVKAIVKVGNFTAAEAEVGTFTVKGVEITEGDGSKYVVGQDGTLTFKSNGPYPLFEGIKVDGKTVDPSKYDSKAGSTYVTLHRDYVESLGAGEHTIQFIYDYNVSSNVADFTIQKADTPKTGDTNSTVVWIVLSAIAALAIFGCAYRIFRSEN